MRQSLESEGYRADGREIKRGSSTLCTSWRRSSVGNGPLFVPAPFIRLISAPMIHSPFPKQPNRRRRTIATRTRVQLIRHASFCLRVSSPPSSAPVGHVSHVLSFFRSETTRERTKVEASIPGARLIHGNDTRGGKVEEETRQSLGNGVWPAFIWQHRDDDLTAH